MGVDGVGDATVATMSRAHHAGNPTSLVLTISTRLHRLATDIDN